MDYATSSGDSTIDQVIVSGGGDATKYFSDLRSRLLGCTTWSITRRSGVTTTSISPVTSPKVGDDMIAISITTTRTKDGSKDVSTVVAVRVGNIMSSIIKDGNQPGPEINAMVTKTVDRIKGLTPAR